MTNVLVVGGGISGLATSVVLARDGLEVELIKRHDEVRALGSGLTAVGPALRALDRLSLLAHANAP